MRHLSYENIKNIQKLYPPLKNYNNFIETGTYMGGTIIPLSKYYKQLYTIEINPNAYIHSKNLAKQSKISNINFYLGDSSKIITEIIPELDGPTIYFLDAHTTDNGSGFTGKGDVDVPLLEELNIINELDKRECVIIIDDLRLFGIESGKMTANADWTNITLSNILNCFPSTRIVKHFIDPSFKNSTKTKKPYENDRYIIILKET